MTKIDTPFIHLHCHSYYSLLNGTASPEELVRRASEYNMPALALTDFCNLHGIPEFCRSAKQYGIKPILGMESVTAERSLVDGGITYGLTLLAMNEEGWQNLMQLSSLAFLKSFYGTPTIDKELLRKHNAGLICLSGFAGGEIGRSLINDLTGGYEKAKAVAQWYLDIFGDRYYLELRNHGIEAQDTLVWQTIDIGWELNIPTVATHDIHYLNREDCKLHDLLLCIKNGKTVFDEDRPRMESDQHFFCLPKVWGKFRKWRREWYAAENRTVEIADRIDPDIFSTFYSKKHHSVFPLPPSKSADELLRELCLAGFEKRYANSPFADEAKQRLEWELTVIQKIGQANYFLIAGDIVRYSKEQEIFHAARGSANGSLVCYVLGISHVCPLEFGLLFERFSCWNQNESPNIDIDFEQDRRVEIIAYAAEKYGKDCIVSLGTISTFGLKGVIKDIGRALDRPIQFVDDVVKLIPSTLGMTVDKALEESAELQKLHDIYSQARLLIDYARKIEGLPRNACIHPCGFAIADVPLVDFVPLQKGYHDVATQWNGTDIEDVGVLRLDFLGLRTLTILAEIIENIKETKGETIAPYNIPLDDRQTFDLISQGGTVNVFQLESEGMRKLLQRLKPDNFKDIVAVLALYRPGPPVGVMVERYIAVKHGEREAEYLHPVMEEILSETHGIMVYQEQVMQILSRLGNIPLTDAYLCIKAISKKKDFSQFRERFLGGYLESNQARETGEAIFEQVMMFAPYSFNKAHSVAYARIAYITAYLKAHYPEEFAAACSEH